MSNNHRETINSESWYGFCWACKILWAWPKDSHSYAEDMKFRPKCPECDSHLDSTPFDPDSVLKQTSRKEVDLPIKGQFCERHASTAENPEGTDCMAHLAEGRVFKCPYQNADQALLGRSLDGHGVCADYGPREHGTSWRKRRTNQEEDES